MCFPIVNCVNLPALRYKSSPEVTCYFYCYCSLLTVHYYCHCYYDFMRSRRRHREREKEKEKEQHASDERMRTGDKETVLRSTENFDKTSLSLFASRIRLSLPLFPFFGCEERQSESPHTLTHTVTRASEMYYSHSCTD